MYRLVGIARYYSKIHYTISSMGNGDNNNNNLILLYTSILLFGYNFIYNTN